jgi:hypothetical protein
MADTLHHTRSDAANLLNNGVANTKVSDNTIVQSTGAMHPVKGVARSNRSRIAP